MAENTFGDMDVQVPTNAPDLQGENNQVDDGVEALHTERDVAWNAILEFVKSLSEDEIREARRQFCGCVNSIIQAYKSKAEEIKELTTILNALKKKSGEQDAKIEQLQRTIDDLQTQLASSVCEKCGENRVTRQPTSSSMQESKNKPFEVKKTEIDGRADKNIERRERKYPREDEENGVYDDSTSDDSQSSFTADIRCPYAPCGLVALFRMFHKMKIPFCPTKFTQRFGADTRHEGPRCTTILNSLKDLHFLKMVYKIENIDDEKDRKDALTAAAMELLNSRHKVGLLSYSTPRYNHCVTVYIKGKKIRLKIHDAHLDRDYIENLQHVSGFELLVLKLDKNHRPLIFQKWQNCHSDFCKQELKQLSVSNANKQENPSSRSAMFEECRSSV